ncbi:MAG TPA: TetR/AcrR family transcriptional regulator C-terminal domain-containing protein [Spirochaetia bacterium]|nr:TetR/AcrR family transcriptional regulator C-terminal domain-containing protein [Spirochaetia bacterium]
MKTTARRRQKPRGRPVRDSSAALTREKIVTAALQILDRDGLAALSMRRLGSLLGVDPMAIYYHLPNKAALYDAIVEAVMSEIPLAPAAQEGPPIEQLRRMACAYRDALLAHPNALAVVVTRPVRTPASLRPIERMLAVIASLGFTPQESIAFVDVCGHYIMGWAQTYAAHLQDSEVHQHGPMPMDELPPEEFPNLHRIMKEAPDGNPFAVEFDLGMDAILSGLLRRPNHPAARD